MSRRASQHGRHDRSATAERRRCKKLGMAFEPLEERCLLSARPLITEFMADNQSTLFNEFLNSYQDWIEIYNPGPGSVDLEGWYLTDRKNELHGWQFPASVVLEENQYLLVFASGVDPETVVPEGEWHANFRLGRNGEYLGLVRPDGTTIVAEYEPEYPCQVPDVSYGLTASLDEETFFTTPTPGMANPPEFKASVFSPEHGFFSTPIIVAVDIGKLTEPIHYTLDGSVPTTSDPLYETPIHIEATTTLRVKAFGAGSEQTVYTQTYLYLQDVVEQPAASSGWPDEWRNAEGEVVASDYEFDPDVAAHPDYAGSLSEDLLALPSVALTVDPADLFDPATGIYANPLESGRAWERSSSLEMIYPDGREGLQVDAGVRGRGGGSRDPNNTPKHSFQLAFRTEYGPSILEADLLDDADVSEFDRLYLTAGMQDTWLDSNADRRQNAVLMRDQWVRDTHRAMGQPSAAGQFVHVYLNGLYWGVYNLSEQVDDAFGSIHFGGRKRDYDVIDSGDLDDGEIGGWQAMLTLVDGGLQTDESYRQIQQYVDVTSFIDFMILRIFAGDEGIGGGDWVALRNRSTGEPFRFFTSDGEQTLSAASDDVAGVSDGDEVIRLFLALRENEQFRRAFGDRVQQHFFQGGALTPERNAERWESRAETLADAAVAESARWGDYRRDVHAFETGPYELYTRDDFWQVESARLLDDYFPVRSDTVLSQFRREGLSPDVPAPEFSAQSRTITPGFSLTMTSDTGEIVYTTDGTDPALPDGTINPDAIQFTDPILFDRDTVVRARTDVDGQWSALAEASFYLPLPVHITEVHYHATPDPDDGGLYEDQHFDFVELMNVGLDPVDLRQMALAGAVRFSFGEGEVSTLEAGQRVVVVDNIEAFSSRYDTSRKAVAGEYEGRLLNSSERLALVGSLGQVISEVTYDDSWYPITDGDGFSLVRQDEVTPVDNPTAPSLWRPSRFHGGSPGQPDGGLNPDTIVISEALTHSDGSLGDWLELHNTTDQDVDIGGWYLSDTRDNLQLYTIPDGTILPPDEYIVFSHEYDPLYTGPYRGQFDFLLSKLGEKIYLISAGRDGELGGYRVVVDFTYGFNSTTFIRHTNSTGQTEYVPSLQKTPGRRNSAPAVERIRDHGRQFPEAVISEIMVHPAAGGDEYIELFNPHDETALLDKPFQPSWRFTSGVFYNFPEGATIPPRTFALVVPIDPETFRAKYQVPADTQVFGPYNGELLSTGERLVLTRAAEPAAFVPFSMTDQVFYNHPSGDWPAEASGMGTSLNRVSYRAYGNDVTNWTAGVIGGTPGRTNIDLDPSARVVDRMVFYNNSSFDGNDASTGEADHAAIAVDKWPLLLGGQARFENYTSYPLGINGIMVDIQNLPAPLTAADFEFRAGNHGSPAGWAPGPDPLSVSTRMGVGVNGSDRVTVIWPDGTIVNEWLQVTILANERTGLATADVHLWRNAAGDTGNLARDAVVDRQDRDSVRTNRRGNAAVVVAYDIDRDGQVDKQDEELIQGIIHAAPAPTALIDLRSGAAMQGDMDLDGGLDFDDIGAFLVGLNDSERYLDLFGVPALLAGDTDGDADLDQHDIDEFVRLLSRDDRGMVAGDMNLNGVLDGDDIARFAQGLSGNASYWAAYGTPRPATSDLDRDGDTDFDDIDDFMLGLNDAAAHEALFGAPPGASDDADGDGVFDDDLSGFAGP